MSKSQPSRQPSYLAPQNIYLIRNLLSSLLQVIVYVTHNLLNVLVQIANKMGFKKNTEYEKKKIRHYVTSCYAVLRNLFCVHLVVLRYLQVDKQARRLNKQNSDRFRGDIHFKETADANDIASRGDVCTCD
jgi:hypothetical protein